MKTSVVFPQREIGNDPGVIRDFVQAVEAMGYDCLYVSEGGYTGWCPEGRVP